MHFGMSPTGSTLYDEYITEDNDMFSPKAAFSGFSVDDIAKAKEFYTGVLGLKAKEQMSGLLITLPAGGETWAYPKEDHQPAAYTMLNFMVDDIDAAVDALVQKGVEFEKYEGLHQDEKGIAHGKAANMGPDIAWFKDPAGNILAVLEV
jgi:catechol 2,3-dioxygenase-like lactoylglutathione lyase family enzyme